MLEEMISVTLDNSGKGIQHILAIDPAMTQTS